MSRELTDADRSALADLVPLLRRVAGLDLRALARLQIADGRVTAWVRLPFGVLASRRVVADSSLASLDVTVRAAEALAWAEGGAEPTARAAEPAERAATAAPAAGASPLPEVGRHIPAPPPPARDAEWRWAVPPARGWQHVETVPDDVIRPLVRSGALTLKAAAEREGVPGAQPRADVADALLDSVVLTAEGGGHTAAITLRPLSALTRLGFLPRGGEVRIDRLPGWIRVSGEYGSTYLETRAALRLI